MHAVPKVVEKYFHKAARDLIEELGPEAALARALALPHLEPIASPVEGLITTQTPVEGNGPGGDSTVGFFQYDRVSSRGGVRPANHNNIPGSPEGLRQLEAFLGGLPEGRPARIIDPYEELGTAPLP